MMTILAVVYKWEGMYWFRIGTVGHEGLVRDFITKQGGEPTYTVINVDCDWKALYADMEEEARRRGIDKIEGLERAKELAA